MNVVPNEGEERVLGKLLQWAREPSAGGNEIREAMLDETAGLDAGRQVMMIRSLKRKGLYEVALRYAEALYERYRETDDQEGEMSTAAELGHMHRGLGNLEQALKYVHRACELARSLRAKQEEHRFLLLLAMLHKKKQDYRTAMKRAEESLEVMSDEGEHFRAHAVLADCCIALGDYPRGEEHLRAGLDLVVQSGNPRDEAMLLSTMGELKRNMGDSRGALHALKSAEEICALAGRTEQLLKVQREMLSLAKQMGERDAVVGILTRQMTAAEKGDAAVIPVILFFLTRELLQFVQGREADSAAAEMARLFHGLNQFVEVNGDVSTSFLFYLNVVIMLQLWCMGGREDALNKARELDEASGGELKLEEFLETGAPAVPELHNL